MQLLDQGHHPYIYIGFGRNIFTPIIYEGQHEGIEVSLSAYALY